MQIVALQSQHFAWNVKAYLLEKVWHFMQIVALQRQQFAWNVKAYFLEKVRKISSFLLAAKFAKKLVG